MTAVVPSIDHPWRRSYKDMPDQGGRDRVFQSEGHDERPSQRGSTTHLTDRGDGPGPAYLDVGPDPGRTRLSKRVPHPEVDGGFSELRIVGRVQPKAIHLIGHDGVTTVCGRAMSNVRFTDDLPAVTCASCRPSLSPKRIAKRRRWARSFRNRIQ